MGRYIQSDPVGLKAGVNTFIYTQNNPELYIDLYGTTQEQINAAYKNVLNDYPSLSPNVTFRRATPIESTVFLSTNMAYTLSPTEVILRDLYFDSTVSLDALQAKIIFHELLHVDVMNSQGGGWFSMLGAEIKAGFGIHGEIRAFDENYYRSFLEKGVDKPSLVNASWRGGQCPAPQ